MKKLLGLSLVCAFFLAMLSIPTTAEAKNWKIFKKRIYPDNSVIYHVRCTIGNNHTFIFRKAPQQPWRLDGNGSSQKIRYAQQLATQNGRGDLGEMSTLFCTYLNN